MYIWVQLAMAVYLFASVILISKQSIDQGVLVGWQDAPQTIQDISTFYPLFADRSEILTDGKVIVMYGQQLQGADPATFKLIGNYYAKDAAHVYALVDGEEPYIGLIQGADPQTFVPLGDGTYTKDAAHVFWFGLLVEGADPASFSLIRGSGFAKDKAHLYFKKYNFDDLGVDPNTTVILEGGYFKDAEHAYHLSYEHELVLTDDLSNFVVFKEDSAGYAYAKDSQHVWSNGDVVVGADPATFTATGDTAQDKNHHYNNGEVVQ